ncbi:hypothetical protein [Mucilaginibacter sp.]|uniref:hypothetical protein n=1 Tax=Mucilaginibacter sp. TaxID=1882438 RepID=UPI002ED5FAA9
MKPITLLSIIVITALTLASCSGSFELKTYDAIKSAKKKFPNLVIFDGKEYELVRCLSISDTQAKIQLFQPATSPDRLQLMLVISNSSSQFYAIPVPSIRFKSYWDFVYDTSSKQVGSGEKTFETEINKALDTLKLNVGYDGSKVLNEIFVSVLQARVINKTDSANLKVRYLKKSTFPDSCEIIAKQNYEAIARSAIQDSLRYFYEGDVFLKGQKIFNINYLPLKQGKKTYYKIEVYRQPCVIDVVPIEL